MSPMCRMRTEVSLCVNDIGVAERAVGWVHNPKLDTKIETIRTSQQSTQIERLGSDIGTFEFASDSCLAYRASLVISPIQ